MLENQIDKLGKHFAAEKETAVEEFLMTKNLNILTMDLSRMRYEVHRLPGGLEKEIFFLDDEPVLEFGEIEITTEHNEYGGLMLKARRDVRRF